jgi:addiction module toxin, relE/stbE family
MEYPKKYTILIGKKAEKFLETLSEPYYSNIVQALDLLTENPRPIGCKKLTNDDKYRVRVGNYRILYEIHEDIITIEVVTIAHRKDVYKKR